MNLSEFKPVPDFPNYFINPRGSIIKYIKTKNTYKLLKPFKRGSRMGNYLCIDLSRNGKKSRYDIHRLVAFIFLPPPSDPGKIQVHHRDHNPYNPVADNLEWVTPSENMRYQSLYRAEASA